MYTPNQIWAFAIACFGLILTILNIVAKSIAMTKNADAPQKLLEERVKVLEVKVGEHERSLQSGRDEFREQRETNEVMQTCILALIDFELSYIMHTNYNEDVTDLTDARDVLRRHLLRK